MSTGPSSRTLSVPPRPAHPEPRVARTLLVRRQCGGARDLGRPMLRRIPLDDPTPAAVAALAPQGVLRAAINLSNFLLVTRTRARRAADRCVPRHGSRAGTAARRRHRAAQATTRRASWPTMPWPTRGTSATSAPSPPVPRPSRSRPRTARSSARTSSPPTRRSRRSTTSTSQARRIASAPRAAYDLWLERNLRHAELVRSTTWTARSSSSSSDGLDALAGLRPALLEDARAVARVAGARRPVLVGAAGDGHAARPRRCRVRLPVGVRRGDEGERLRRRPHRRPRRRRTQRRSPSTTTGVGPPPQRRSGAGAETPASNTDHDPRTAAERHGGDRGAADRSASRRVRRG